VSHSRTMFGILLVGLVSPTVRSPAQAQSGQLTTIYSFAGAPADGVEPSGGVVMGANGVLYGTTTWGGASASGTGVSGDGTVFQLTPPAATGGTWTETLLYSFSGSDGAAPRAALLIGGNGDLYGTASEGGTYGTAFELAPPAAARGVWTYTLLHTFKAVRTETIPRPDWFSAWMAHFMARLLPEARAARFPTTPGAVQRSRSPRQPALAAPGPRLCYTLSKTTPVLPVWP